MRQTPPSSSTCIPFLNWFVLTCSAIGAPNLANGCQLLRERGQHLEPVVGDDREVLDPDPADAAQVDAGLDRDDVAGGEDVARLPVEVRALVELEADAVAEPVAE